MFKDPNVENALKQVEGPSLMLYSVSPGDWSAALKGSDVERLLKVSVNPRSKVENSHGLLQFSAYINNFIRAMPLGSMLQASDVIGNISFSRPVLYVFPGHQGDAALFGMKGFNMLINGGYSRHSCFWDFVRHLDGIDALLLTHLGPDNLFGIKAVLERKGAETIHPDIDYMYMNAGKASNGVKALANGDAATDGGSLVINLAAEGGRLLELSRKLGHAPHPLTRPPSGNLEPINLFHKVGKASLDMYVLNPVGDAKEMKDFLTQWGKQAPSFSQANGVPIPNCTSVCALLVVRPASPTEKVTRILFPGNAPQHKLLEGLERVKHLEFLKHPTFCTHDLHKPKKTPSATGNGRAGSATRRVPPSSATSRTMAGANKPEPPKRLETKVSATRVLSASPASAKAAKLQKDSNNKRASSAKDKEKVKLDEKEKEDKSKSSKSSTSSSPSKASVKTASPVKSPTSPVKTPATASPDDVPEIPSSPIVPTQAPPAPEAAAGEPSYPFSPQSNHLDQDLMSMGAAADVMKQAPFHPPEPSSFPADDNRMVDSPEALPEPERYGSDVDFGLQRAANIALTEREKLRELGVYDDDDEGVDNGFDDKENGGLFRASGSPEADDEDVQPQHLPEPVAAAVESPTTAEPDLIQDTFSRPAPSVMEQSQIFEDGIEPDYEAVARDFSAAAADCQGPEPFEMMESASPAPAEPFKQEAEEMEEAAPPVRDEGPIESSPEPEEEEPKGFAFGDHLKEVSPAPEEQSFSDKEPSPDPQGLGLEGHDLKEVSPAPEEQSFSDKEQSPDPQGLGFGEGSPAPEEPRFSDDDDLKEASPALEEPSFVEEENEVAQNSNTIEQSIQYGVTNDNGFQMGGIREEEEEEVEEVVAVEKEEVERAADQGAPDHQAGDLMDEREKRAMQDLGVYEDQDQDQDEDEETAEAGDSGDNEKDAYVYEKDVNLEDEEVRMAAGRKEEERDPQTEGGAPHDFEAEHDQSSNIPEAFEKDETPTPVEKPAAVGYDTGPGQQVDSGREDTDSIDGGTPDDDKDIDEILAMRQQQQQQEQTHLAQEGDEEEDAAEKPMPGQGPEAAEGLPINPFIGLGAQVPPAAPADAEFDPMAQWGPPTGLPAPAPLRNNEWVGEQEEEEAAVGWHQGAAVEEHEGAGQRPDEAAGWQEEAVGAESTDKLSEADSTEFDPLAEWGQPMGLPSPPPPEVDGKGGSSKSGAGDVKKADPKKATTGSPMKSKMGPPEKRPASGAKSPTKQPSNGTAEAPRSARSKPDPKRISLDTSRSARPASGRSLDTSRVESKTRATATATTTTTAAATRRPASAKARASPDVIKMPPLPPFTPFYVDLTYIPNHGDPAYVDGEFFRRVRARYYVLSARNPNPKVLEQLMEAKAAWDKAGEQQVTVIPTYETQILQHWMAVHKERLAENKIDIAPAASRCTVRLQDHEDSCYTYRLEF